MRAAGAAVNCIARIAGITSIIRIKINIRASDVLPRGATKGFSATVRPALTESGWQGDMRPLDRHRRSRPRLRRARGVRGNYAARRRYDYQPVGWRPTYELMPSGAGWIRGQRQVLRHLTFTA
jgi:hypothetical protein